MSNDVNCKVNQIVCISIGCSGEQGSGSLPSIVDWCVAATTPPYQTTPRRMVPIAIQSCPTLAMNGILLSSKMNENHTDTFLLL